MYAMNEPPYRYIDIVGHVIAIPAWFTTQIHKIKKKKKQLYLICQDFNAKYALHFSSKGLGYVLITKFELPNKEFKNVFKISY